MPVSRRLGVALLALFAAVAMLLAVVPPAAAATTYDIDSQGWIDPANSSFQVCAQNNGGCTSLTNSTSVSVGDTVRAEIAFKVGNETPIKAGDRLTYTLPANLQFHDIGVQAFKDASGRTRGTWTVRNGQVIIEFSEDAGTELSGYVTVDGLVTKDSGAGTGGGEIDVSFPGFALIKPTVTPTHELHVQKNAAVAVTSDGKRYEFTLDVTAEGTLTNITLTDTMGDLLTLSEGSIRVCTDPDGTQCLTDGWGTQSESDHGFSLTIDSMADTTLYVKYQVDIDRTKVIEASKGYDSGPINNKVAYRADETTEKTTERALKMYSTWYGKKEGALTADRTGITWTIDVFPGDTPDGTTAAILDALGEGLEPPTGDVTMTAYHRGHEYWDPDKDISTVSWAALTDPAGYELPILDGQLAGRYIITYTTPIAPSDADTATFTNTATVKPSDGTGDLQLPSNVTKQTVSLGKSVLTGSHETTDTVQWMSTLTVSDPLPAGQQYTDSLDGNHAVAADTLNLRICTNSSCTAQLTADAYELTIAESGKGFTVRFTKELAVGTYFLRYATAIDAGNTQWPLTNTARFRSRESTAQYRRSDVDNMDKASLYHYDPGSAVTPVSRGIARWQLKLHDIDGQATDITVTDTFDARLEFIEQSIRAQSCNSLESQCRTQLDGLEVVSVTPVEENGKERTQVVFRLRAGSAAFRQATTSAGLLVIYDTAVIPGTFQKWQGDHMTNTAVLSIDGDAQLPDTQTLWVTAPDYVDKNQTYDAQTAPNVEYSVEVNSAAQTLNDGEPYRLTDMLPESMNLVQGSVSIVDLDAADGGALPGATYSYDPQTRRLVITMPDAKAALVTYEALVLLKPGESLSGKAINTVRLTGEHMSDMSDDTGIQVNVVKPTAGMTDTQYGLQVYKYADGVTEHPLADAVFAIEELAVDQNAGGKSWKSTGSTMRTSELVSGVDGYTDVFTSQLKANTIYRISEIKAPAGYRISEQPAVTMVFPASESSFGKTAADYDGVTVDGQPLYVAALSDGTPLQRFQWLCSNPSERRATLSIGKTDGTAALPGAVLQLRNGRNDVVKQWTSTGERVTVGNLAPDVYTLHEVSAPDGYDMAADIVITVASDGVVTVDGRDVRDAAGIGQVTMVDPPQVTEVKARKVWDDDADRDGLRRDVTFALYRRVAGGSWTVVRDSVRTVAKDAAAGATVSWEDLPVAEGGKAVSYEPREMGVPSGYTGSGPLVADDGVYEITNTHKPETTKVKVSKRWVNRDQDAAPPTSVKVELLADGKSLEPACVVTLRQSADGDHAADGEGAVDGEAAVDGNAEADGDAADGAKAAGCAAAPGGDAPDDASWPTYEFSGLPKYAQGVPIVYTVRETVPEGYTAAVTGTSTTDYVVTNTYHPKDGLVRFAKRSPNGANVADAQLRLERWDEGSNQWVQGPPEAADDFESADGTTDVADGTASWSWTSGSADHELRLQAGRYRLVEESAPEGFQLSAQAKAGVEFTVDLADDDTLTLKNADGKVIADATLVVVNEVERHPVSISKQALGGDGQELPGATLRLAGITLDGEAISREWATGECPEPVDLEPGAYRLHEVKAPAGYETAADITFTIGVDGTVTVDGQGEMTGGEDGSPTVTLYDAPKAAPFSVSKTDVGDTAELAGAEFTLSGTDLFGNAVSYEWTSGDAPKAFLLKDGSYTLSETKAPAGHDRVAPIDVTVAGGVVTMHGRTLSGTTLRVENRTSPVTAISVEKQWSDGNDRDGLRPGELQVRLKRNNVNCDEDADGDYCGTGSLDKVLVTLSDSAGWSHTFPGLPQNDPDTGERYSYTVDERIDAAMSSNYHVAVSQYPRQDGLDYRLVNIHAPESLDIELTKVWDDDDDRDGLRPDGIGVRVIGTSSLPVTASLTGKWQPTEVTMIQYPDANDVLLKANADGTWHWTLENLPKRNIYGNPYTYRVEELPLTVDGQPLQERADGSSNLLASRTDPSEPAYTTKVEDTPIAGNPNEDGICKVPGADRMPAAQSDEAAAPAEGGIERCASTITNTHVPETTTLTVRKQWDDNHDSAGLRPRNLTVWLLGSIWEDDAAADAGTADGGADSGVGDEGTGTSDGNAAGGTAAFLPGWPFPQAADGTCGGLDYGSATLSTSLGRSCIVLTANGAAPSIGVIPASPSEDATDDAMPSDVDAWPEYTFTDLPKYYRGKEIHYSVTESFEGPLAACNGLKYEPAVELTAADGEHGTLATAVLTNTMHAVRLPSTGGERNTPLLIALGTVCTMMLALGVAMQRLQANTLAVAAVGRARHGHGRHAGPRPTRHGSTKSGGSCSRRTHTHGKQVA